ncbi:hypothetical protein [Corallococcus sp. AB018]|uniref:hypothetical protein n=1 Tax=Corallococcus sp. AB018 TaxID=2316715 RepID=UPI001315927A|nr:hypothetical protein [Corallococcus sp. AB018]
MGAATTARAHERERRHEHPHESGVLITHLFEEKTRLEAELRDLKTRPSVPLIAVNF